MLIEQLEYLFWDSLNLLSFLFKTDELIWDAKEQSLTLVLIKVEYAWSDHSVICNATQKYLHLEIDFTQTWFAISASAKFLF